MIGVLAPSTSTEAARLVLAALRRSVTHSQAECYTLAALRETRLDTLVAIDPPESWMPEVLAWLSGSQRKLIVFGRLPQALVTRLGARLGDWPAEFAHSSRSESAPAYQFRESPAGIWYSALAAKLGGRQWSRALERFDFTDEWNNLGYGAIRAGATIWSVAMPIRLPEPIELAQISVEGKAVASYAALADDLPGSLLWFNRPVGPVDSFEWYLIEQYIANYRHDDLSCHPVVREVPWGHDAAVTFRLDCDEDVESARPLMDAYREWRVPFSLAVHTTNLSDSRHYAILRELHAAGGGILSHTATHAPNWGGSYQAAMAEATQSASAIAAVTGESPRYAVSPFHQTPDYALSALADAGYTGCIGGIIRNDPEFLLARGGELAGLPRGFVGHSQQCMLHGDCMLEDDDPLQIFKQAFDLAMATNTLFGYLDHPFSERYAYGWPEETIRINRHKQFLDHIRSSAKAPVFWSEIEALDFLRLKASCQVIGDGTGLRLLLPEDWEGMHTLAVDYRGRCFPARHGEIGR